jgi:hypothetical protein
MSENLIDHIKKSMDAVSTNLGQPAYAAIMRENILDMVIKECEEEAGIKLSRENPTLFGLKLEKNAFMPENQILIVPKDMYDQMKQNLRKFCSLN